jgi:hypothetical protein
MARAPLATHKLQVSASAHVLIVIGDEYDQIGSIVGITKATEAELTSIPTTVDVGSALDQGLIKNISVGFTGGKRGFVYGSAFKLQGTNRIGIGGKTISGKTVKSASVKKSKILWI